MTLMVNICVAECGNNGFLAFMQSQLYKSFMCKLSHTLYTHVISYPAGPTFDDILLCAANSNHLEVRICNPPFQRRVRGRLKGARAKSQQEIPPHTQTLFLFLFFFSLSAQFHVTPYLRTQVENMFQRVQPCRNCGTPGHSAS